MLSTHLYNPILSLENNELITRYKAIDDQRKNMLAITSKGKKIIEEIFEQTKKEETELFKFLSLEECIVLEKILSKLILEWEKLKEE